MIGSVYAKTCWLNWGHSNMSINCGYLCFTVFGQLAHMSTVIIGRNWEPRYVAPGNIQTSGFLIHFEKHLIWMLVILVNVVLQKIKKTAWEMVCNQKIGSRESGSLFLCYDLNKWSLNAVLHESSQAFCLRDPSHRIEILALRLMWERARWTSISPICTDGTRFFLHESSHWFWPRDPSHRIEILGSPIEREKYQKI